MSDVPLLPSHFFSTVPSRLWPFQIRSDDSQFQLFVNCQIRSSLRLLGRKSATAFGYIFTNDVTTEIIAAAEKESEPIN